MGLWLKQDGEMVPVGGGGGGTGEDGKGWTGGSYDPTTGVVTFTSDDGLEFVTGDLRGTDGIDGLDGNMWHVGSGAPDPTLGDPGDYYLDGTDGWVYVKRSNSAWTNLYVNLTGPPGDSGGSHDHDYLPLTGGRLTGTLWSDGQFIATANGGQTSPRFQIGEAAGLGMYGSAGSQWLRFTTDDVWRLQVSASGVVTQGDLQVGGNLVSTSDLFVKANGAEYRFTDRYLTSHPATGGARLRADAAGNAAEPAFGFFGDPDTGIYNIAGNSMGFATAGTRRLQIGTTHANFGPDTGTGTASIKVNAVGDKTQAAYGFRGDLSTGMYRSAAGEVTFTSGGNNAFKYNASYFAHPATGGARLKRGAGTQAEPAFGFFGDPDTGIWRPKDNQIEIITKGARAAYFGAEGTSGKGVFLPGIRFNETAVYKANTTVMGLPGGGLFHTLMTRRLMTATEPVASYAFERLFDLKPLFFRSLGEHDDKTKSHYGLAAEDVAEIDPRLATWGEDRDGNVVPENVDHDAMIALLVASVKRQRDQIADLTARLDKMEA